MTEPKIGMKFGNYAHVLSNARKNGLIKKISSYTTKDGGKVTDIFMKDGSYMSKTDYYSCGFIKLTKVSYATENFMYTGSSTYNRDYTAFTEIYGEGSRAIDLNGNGIVDKGEIKRNP